MNPNVLAFKSKLTTEQLMILQTEIAKHKKSTGTAYLLLIFLSWTGAHQFYLRNSWRGVFYVLASLAPFTLFVSGIVVGFSKKHDLSTPGILVLCACLFLLLNGAIMWTYDLFTLSGQTESANDRIEFDTMLMISPHSKSA